MSFADVDNLIFYKTFVLIEIMWKVLFRSGSSVKLFLQCIS